MPSHSGASATHSHVVQFAVSPLNTIYQSAPLANSNNNSNNNNGAAYPGYVAPSQLRHPASPTSPLPQPPQRFNMAPASPSGRSSAAPFSSGAARPTQAQPQIPVGAVRRDGSMDVVNVSVSGNGSPVERAGDGHDAESGVSGVSVRTGSRVMVSPHNNSKSTSSKASGNIRDYASDQMNPEDKDNEHFLRAMSISDASTEQKSLSSSSSAEQDAFAQKKQILKIS